MSVRTKFTSEIVFFFVIILMLFALSAIQMSFLPKKTNVILTENQLSVVCAIEMAENLNENTQHTKPLVTFRENQLKVTDAEELATALVRIQSIE